MQDLRKVTDAPDPLAEREHLDRRRATLAKTLEECQRADGQARTEFAAAAARLETSEEARKNATKDANQSREAALKAALEAGFRDEAAAAGAQLSPSEQQQISENVQMHRDERRTVEARMAELIDEAGRVRSLARSP